MMTILNVSLSLSLIFVSICSIHVQANNTSSTTTSKRNLRSSSSKNGSIGTTIHNDVYKNNDDTTLAAAMISSTKHKKKKSKPSPLPPSKKTFDFYVLSMSYQPQFCYQHRHENFPGCEKPMDFWKKSLTIHGLWPENNNGSWPSTCTNEKFDPETVEIIGYDRFNTYWPNVKASSHSQQHHDDSDSFLERSSSSSPSTYYSFWNHEWTKHGTCSGLNQVQYFNTTLNHFLHSPNIIAEKYGQSISKEELLKQYKQTNDGNNSTTTGSSTMMIHDVVLVCAGGGKFLSEVRTCVSKQSSGSTEAADGMDCILQVEEEGNCNDEIKLTKFYSDDDYDEMMYMHERESTSSDWNDEMMTLSEY